MSAMSRTKGQSGEREAATLVGKLTGFDVRRRVRQHDGDSDLEGLPGWSIEVKRYRSVTPALIGTWWAQALAQARRTQTKPVLIYRGDRSGWRCVWPARLHLGDWLDEGVENTIEARPETWWAMVSRQ